MIVGGDLVAVQTSPNVKGVSPPSVLLTMVAIKILREKFVANKNEWKLIGQKGMLFLKKTLALTEKQVNDLIEQTVYELVK